MECVVPKQMNNPEALLDVLAMQSLRQRHGTQKKVSFAMTSDIDELVQSFTIDDSIAECFAPCDKNTKGGKIKKSVNKEKEGPVSLFKNYGKRSPWKNSNTSLSSNSVNNGSKKSLTGGVFQKKAKKPASPRNLPTSGSPRALFKMAGKSSSSLDVRSRKTPFKLISSTLLCPDALTFTPQNKSDLSLNSTIRLSPELSPLTQKNGMATRKFEPITTSCIANPGFAVCDVTSTLSTRPANEIVMEHLKQAIKLDNERELKILLSQIHPNSHAVSVNNLVHLASMAAHLGQDNCLLTLLDFMSSASHVTSRDKQTIARAASQEAVRTDHVMCLQLLVAEGFSIWEDQHPSILEESRRCGSVVCYRYMLLLHVLALTWGKSIGNASINEILKSVYKQYESSDADINTVIQNVLEQHGCNIDKNQMTKPQQNISVEEEDYVSLSQQNGCRTGNAKEEGCSICTFNPCICGKHETRMKSRPCTVDKMLQYPPPESLINDTESGHDAVIEEPQSKCFSVAQIDVISVPDKSSILSNQHSTDSNNNLPQTPVGSSDQSLATYSNQTIPHTSSGLTDQMLAINASASLSKQSEVLSNQFLATYSNMNLTTISEGMSNPCTVTTRRCNGETISKSVHPLKLPHPTDESSKDRRGQGSNRHLPEILEAGACVSKPQQNRDKDDNNSTDDDNIKHPNVKLSSMSSNGANIADSLPSSNTSNDSYWSESQSLLITGNAFTDCTSDSQSFPTISEWCSSTSNITSYCSDDEESSYYSEDDDGNYNTVVLNLEDEELDPEQLSEQRLRKHLESTRRQIYHNSDYVETVITATGQRLSENGHVLDASLDKEFRESKDDHTKSVNNKRLLTYPTSNCRYTKDRDAPELEDKSKENKNAGCIADPEVGFHSLAEDKFAESVSAANGQHSVGLHRDTHLTTAEQAEWNYRPWYEVSDDDSLCLNRSNDSDSDVISW